MGGLLVPLLLALGATVASFPARAIAARGRASGTLTIRAGGLPPGQAAQIAVLHGRRVVRSGSIRALELRLPRGRYRLVVLRLRVSHAGGSVRRGALALPVRRSIPFTIVPHRRVRLLARYGTIVNPGVRRVPAGISSVVGDPNDPSGLVLARGGSGVRVGMILTSGPSGALPVGLIARVTRIRRHGSGELVSLAPAPLSSAVPAIVTNAPIELNAVAASGGSSGLGVKVEVDVAGDCGLTGEVDVTPIVKLDHVRFSSDIQLSPWGGGPRLDFAISAHQEVGFRLDTSSGVKCSVPLLDPTLVGVVLVGLVPVPVYVSIPITLNAELTQATHLQATASWDAAYGMRTHKKFLGLIPTPFFEAHKVSGNVSATSGPEFTFEPNIAVEPGIGVPHLGNIHLDAGTGVEFSLEPGECKWDWRIGTFSAEAELGPVKLGTPDFTAKTVPLWEGCQGAGAVPPPPPPPPPPSPESSVTFPGGPLGVSVGALGQCQSSYGELGGEYFLPSSSIGDCGFFLAFPSAGEGQPPALQGTTWGFDGAAGPRGVNAYTPVAQSPVSGSGSEADPYRQVTRFEVTDSQGAQDASIVETTTYVNGASQFSSTYTVKNTASTRLYFRALYAGDLYIGGNDYGGGVFEAGPPRFVGGVEAVSNAVGGFQEAPAPAPAWSAFQEGCWNDASEELAGRCTGAGASDGGIWHTLETTVEEPQAFNDTIEPSAVDNAVGVEWDQLRSAGLAPGSEQSFTIVNVYRP